MTETTPSPLSNVIRMTTSGPPRPVVRGSVEETLNALPEAEANRLCKAQHYALMACSTFRGSDKHAFTTPNPIKHGCPLKCTACGSRCLVRHVIDDRPCRLPKRSREKELKAAAAREVIERLGSNASPTWEWSRQSPRG